MLRHRDLSTWLGHLCSMLGEQQLWIGHAGVQSGAHGSPTRSNPSPLHRLAGNYGRLTSDRQARQMVLDLRQTLWHWKLGNVLVFEKEQHIETFRQRANRAGKVLRG